MGEFPDVHIGVHASVSEVHDELDDEYQVPFLPGYLPSLENAIAKKRYKEKLGIIGGLDPYEIVRSEWVDDIDMWPSVTCVHIAMYLLVTPSPHT